MGCRKLQIFIFLSTGHTYVKAQSPHLDRTVRQAVAAFSNDLCRKSGTNNGAGQISLEFFQKKKGWIYQEDIPWEVWTIRCKLVHHVNEQERLGERVKVEEMLSDKVELVSKELNHLAAILHVYAGGRDIHIECSKQFE